MVKGFRERGPFAYFIADIPKQRLQTGRGGTLRKQVQSLQNRKACFDQRVKLLVEDQKIGTLEKAALAAANRSAKQTTPRLHGINVQAPVRELLAGLSDRLRGFHMGKDTPSRIRHFAYKLCHGLPVYLIPVRTGTPPSPTMFFVLNS